MAKGLWGWLMGNDQEDRDNGTKNYIGKPAGARADECSRSRDGYHDWREDSRGNLKCKACGETIRIHDR